MKQLKDRNRFNMCKCGKEKDQRAKFCRPCWLEGSEKGPKGLGGLGKKAKPLGTRLLDDDGYIRIKVGRDYPGNILGWIKEHRFVMEQNLGRSLHKGETVHHKNGVRGDNHISNLELWTTHQYSGQRVEDLIKSAEEILDLYGSLSLEIGMVMC